VEKLRDAEVEETRRVAHLSWVRLERYRTGGDQGAASSAPTTVDESSRRAVPRAM
jgi:hypothetical protein